MPVWRFCRHRGAGRGHANSSDMIGFCCFLAAVTGIGGGTFRRSVLGRHSGFLGGKPVYHHCLRRVLP